MFVMPKKLGVSEEGFRAAWETNGGNARATARALAINPQTALNWASQYGLDTAEPGRPRIDPQSEALIVSWYEQRGLTMSDIADVLATPPVNPDFPPLSESGVKRVLARNDVIFRRCGPR